MKKTLTTSQVRDIGGTVFTSWEENKNGIKMSGKALYNLIAIKKQLEQKLMVIEETLGTLAAQFGGVTQENGSIKIPSEQRAEANKAFVDMGNEEIEIEYSPIILTNDSVLPVAIYEALFDFISFEE